MFFPIIRTKSNVHYQTMIAHELQYIIKKSGVGFSIKLTTQIYELTTVSLRFGHFFLMCVDCVERLHLRRQPRWALGRGHCGCCA